jgi:hypothetical protein
MPTQLRLSPHICVCPRISFELQRKGGREPGAAGGRAGAAWNQRAHEGAQPKSQQNSGAAGEAERQAGTQSQEVRHTSLPPSAHRIAQLTCACRGIWCFRCVFHWARCARERPDGHPISRLVRRCVHSAKDAADTPDLLPDDVLAHMANMQGAPKEPEFAVGAGASSLQGFKDGKVRCAMHVIIPCKTPAQAPCVGWHVQPRPVCPAARKDQNGPRRACR